MRNETTKRNKRRETLTKFMEKHLPRRVLFQLFQILIHTTGNNIHTGNLLPSSGIRNLASKLPLRLQTTNNIKGLIHHTRKCFHIWKLKITQPPTCHLHLIFNSRAIKIQLFNRNTLSRVMVA
ncbi:hypothetical protein Hanom_Chr11g01063181 [Helianthus anomalus]